MTKNTINEKVYTFGHSTQSLEHFIEVLKKYAITVVFDVRTVPRSRHNPQFNKETLPQALKKAGIKYYHAADLGGLRRPVKDSLNLGWENENSVTFVAEEESKIIGYAAGEIRELPAWRKKSKAAELVEIFVLADYRSHGIGSQFVEEFIKWCQEKGVQRIKIEASFGNTPGINFYKKHGFHEQEVVLEKEL